MSLPALEQKKAANPLVAFIAALQFLTTMPPLIRRRFTAGEMGASIGFYPLVGALIGLLLFGLDALLAFLHLPELLRAALVLIAWTLLTGALHLDGFLDTCDGLLGGFTPESRLEIMRDERVGAYALCGGILLFLFKFSSLATLSARLPLFLLTPLVGRWAISLAVTAFPYARPSGLGREIKDHASWKQALLASLLALGLGWLAAGWAGLLALAFAGLVMLAFARYTLKRIPGLTGDIYGAINELAECAVLLTLVSVQERGFWGA